jgi:hypothetical protein
MGRRIKEVPTLFGKPKYEIESEYEAESRMEAEAAAGGAILWVLCLPFLVIGWIFRIYAWMVTLGNVKSWDDTGKFFKNMILYTAYTIGLLFCGLFAVGSTMVWLGIWK